MKTINIPSNKLIKLIPSRSDGSIIPGIVVRYDTPSVIKNNHSDFVLHYTAYSKLSEAKACCLLDEDLELFSGSNSLITHYSLCETDEIPPRGVYSCDGVVFALRTESKIPTWVGSVCYIPDPFDALGSHQLSNFTEFGLNHVASCSIGYTGNLAVISSTKNTVVKLQLPTTPAEDVYMGDPFRFFGGWGIPWSQKSLGLKIASFEESEFSQLINSTVELKRGK